jgi:signal transduction histidine kinase/CheY-like chemotaxis protein
MNKKDLFKYAGLFLVYFITAKAGLSVGAINKFATLIWPPTGIALSFLLIFGSRFWPSIALAALLVNLMTGASLPGALGIATGNTLEAVVGFYLCRSRQMGFHLSLDRLDDVITLIFRGALFSTVVSASIGVGSLFLTGSLGFDQLIPTFRQWWIGDAMGDLVVAPLILTWVAQQKIERFVWRRVTFLRDILISLACAVLSVVVLSGMFKDNLAPIVGLKGIYILIPLQLWTSMRFGQRGSTLLLFFISAAGLIYTLNGVGPFADSPIQIDLQHLAIFLVVITTTALLVSAVASERESEKRNLEQTTRELRQSEISLTHAKQIAETANALKSSFLANMSHEIRTPLGAVLGFSDLLLQPDLSPALKLSYADAIRRNGMLLSNIINDILDLSKVEAGKLAIERREIDLAEIMSDFQSILSLEASEKGILLEVVAEEALPNRIATDSLRVRQILLNIVGNAIKFTEQGSVTVTLRLIRTLAGTAKLVFEVQDTGRGISPTQAAKLFSPFSQADASTTRKFGGTGLGLTLSKRLAQLLGGDVKLLESRVGKGSTFSISIDPGPVGPVSVHNFELKRKHTELTPIPEAPVQFTDMKVLLVDDSYDNQILITRLLERTKAKIETARNGREGVEKARSKSFDLILMDLQMPEMDGYEATKTLRTGGYTGPIVALTAHAMKDERSKCLENGFDEHLSKPINYKILLSTLERYAEKRV